MLKMVDNEKIDKFKYYIIGMINGIPIQDLKYMIKKEKVPILLEYDLPPFFSFMKDIIEKNKDLILQSLSYDIVLQYSDQYRPDLAGYIRRPEGKKWIERLLKQIKFIVENIQLSSEQMRAKFIAIMQSEQQRRLEKKQMQELLAQQQIKEPTEDNQTEEIKELLNPTAPKPNEPLKSEELKKEKKKNNIADEFGFLYNPHI